MRQAVETAARKNLLRCVVCTPTLLEGVDFPTRTVIAAYLPADHGKPEIARLRNLAGRAGRAGRFTSGSFIAMIPSADHRDKWLQAFRSNLPATPSALTAALRKARAFGRHIDVLEPEVDGKTPMADLDALIIAAIVEGGVIDGDLRTCLEEVLGRTLWWSGASDAERDGVLAFAERRAAQVVNFIGGDRWQTAFYRTGLPMASAIALRDSLTPQAAALAAALQSIVSDLDPWFYWMASQVAPVSRELAHWRILDNTAIEDALRLWIAGEPESSIIGAHPEVWATISGDLETLLPWVMTALVEFTATELAQPALSDLAHQSLGISRLRYGVPTQALCVVVRNGIDRVTATRLAAEFQTLAPAVQHGQDLESYIKARVEAEAAAAVEAAAIAAADLVAAATAMAAPPARG
ncbi:MAG TPA: hypothetical protein PKD80_14065 [Microthrixaceae bacterium]|nr:hypothetical protein [Microthrixaceae bacterium]HMT24587.1 hypothetical protein [Microthrixaceae bacterium]HMT62003.1 hypothetical protein [Microthrixaceae bacterium]